ncbi:cytoplasmic dynein 2 light intermediate chain 1-like isoform X2 [Halichondria panicea]|uniref:cytoplasmic dynein 2 light intermediate chain 1-like isoform X2 n=1 Tax=Halichondria panicea TaxID=6063 RepID=UPI00312B93E2
MESVGGSHRDVWSIALEEKSADTWNKKLTSDKDSTVFIVGAQNSGKTSIILTFLEREEPPKPTTALDYTYGKRSKGANIAKDVTHIWELGGGAILAKLVDIPITVETISNLSVVIVVDLSKPEEIWTTLEVFLKQIRTRVHVVLSELNPMAPELVSKLRTRAWNKFGEKHPDKDLLSPLSVPLAIVGSKYDIFQDFGPEKKKAISRSLRFLAHTNGASLHFSSMKSDVLVNRTKQHISHLAFGTGLSRTMSMDYTKPLLVPAGSDALGQIGVPSLSAGEISKINARNPLELWKQAYCGFFPQVSSHPETVDDPCKDSKYKEPDVDAVRAHKDEEVERYRRECERKTRDLARQRGNLETFKQVV